MAIVCLIKSHATQMAVAMPENFDDSGIELGTDTDGAFTASPPLNVYAPSDHRRLVQPARSRRRSAPPPHSIGLLPERRRNPYSDALEIADLEALRLV